MCAIAWKLDLPDRLAIRAMGAMGASLARRSDLAKLYLLALQFDLAVRNSLCLSYLMGGVGVASFFLICALSDLCKMALLGGIVSTYAQPFLTGCLPCIRSLEIASA